MDLWLNTKYKDLSKRADAFDTLTLSLESLNRPVTIVETGCSRQEYNWEGDGNSTVIWDKFVNYFGGVVYSVDIDPVATQYARSLVSQKTKVITSDSIEWLKTFNTKIDLLYLDSYDIDWNNPEPSMKHHEQELLASLHMLSKDSIVAVDDNLENVGKGYLVEKIAKEKEWTFLINQYIKAWIVK